MEAQSGFRFLVPFQPGQQVGLFNPADALVSSLVEEKVNVTICRKQSDLQAESFDHVLVPILTEGLRDFFPNQFARILRPNGTLLLGFANRTALERLCFWRQKGDYNRTASFSLNGLRNVLKQANLSVIHSYGIRDLERPQHIVSLDQQVPGCFFFDQMFHPHSRLAAAGQSAARVITSLGLHRSLFKYFSVVARKM